MWRMALFKYGLLIKKYPRNCECENCQSTKNKKIKCSYCGKMSVEYVHAIGWECMNRKCPQKIENQSREQILEKYKNIKLINDIE